MSLSCQRLFAGSLVAITDVRCLVRDARCGEEEASAEPELVFPRTGAFVRHVGRESVLADANHVLFFDGGEPYRVSHPLGAGDTTTVLSFAPSVLEEAFPRRSVPGRPSGRRFPLCHCSIGPEVSLTLHGLRRHLLGSRDGGAVEETALGVLHAVADGVSGKLERPLPSCRPATRPRRREVVEDTRLLLARTYRRAFPLAAIAREVGASPFHLVRLFREETGVPIHRYRSLLRLREALQRLADGERDLARLALELGYASHGHFAEAFRAAFGTSPSSYRRGPSRIRARSWKPDPPASA
jgi:AraC-like DNA-binding protein